MNQKKKGMLIVLAVLLLIASIVGISYAYFSSIITKENTLPTVVTTGTMKIEYTNSQEITGEQLLPGWQSEEKTFTVKNTGTLPVVYNIQLTNVTNTFAETIENVTGKPAELVYTLTRDGSTVLESKQFPTEDGIIVPKMEIEPNTTHTYTMQITFKELGVAQNYNQGRSFAGKIEVGETILAKTVAFEEDTSNANAPELNNGMIPVTWDGREWVKADTTKAWYNYDNQAWANAVTVTASSRSTYTSAEANTPIEMNDIETMWVWIPRYEYQHTNLGTTYAGGTKTEPGAITINFISKDTTTASDPDNYTIHDAFWWDENNDGVKDVNEQLSGIWVAKFEMSSDTECEAATNDIGIGCDITTITPKIKPNVTSWRGARIGTQWTVVHEKMNGASNPYGLTNSDTHLMKNMEWGAVAYLSQSKYGKKGNTTYETEADKEIYMNKSTEYITGSSNGTPSQAIRNTQSPYDVEKKGTGASTTGNIYGIYDMSGGASEYVMGVMKESTNTEPAVGYNTSSNSGWSGKLYNGVPYPAEGDPTTQTYGLLKDIESKYYDLYAYSTSSTATEARAHKGDATYEVAGWYSDGASFVSSNNPFFNRGGVQSSITATAGVFCFGRNSGNAVVTGSGRPVAVSQAS